MAKHDSLQWNDQCEEVFESVKEVLGALTSMQALDWEKFFNVNPYGGEDAIGAMLLEGKIKSIHEANILCK